MQGPQLRVIAEVNQGGAMVEQVLREVDDTLSFRAVPATKAKAARAEPVAALYEQGRVSHVGGLPGTGRRDVFGHRRRQREPGPAGCTGLGGARLDAAETGGATGEDGVNAANQMHQIYSRSLQTVFFVSGRHFSNSLRKAAAESYEANLRRTRFPLLDTCSPSKREL